MCTVCDDVWFMILEVFINEMFTYLLTYRSFVTSNDNRIDRKEWMRSGFVFVCTRVLIRFFTKKWVKFCN